MLGLGLDSVLLLYAVLQRPCRHHLALHAECSPLLHSVPLGHLNRAQIQSRGSFLQEHLKHTGQNMTPFETRTSNSKQGNN